MHRNFTFFDPPRNLENDKIGEISGEEGIVCQPFVGEVRPIWYRDNEI